MRSGETEAPVADPAGAVMGGWRLADDRPAEVGSADTCVEACAWPTKEGDTLRVEGVVRPRSARRLADSIRDPTSITSLHALTLHVTQLLQSINAHAGHACFRHAV